MNKLLGAIVILVLCLLGFAWAQQYNQPTQIVGNLCAFNSAPPTLNTGFPGWMQCDSLGRLIVSPGGAGAAGFPTGATPVTNSATGTTTATATLPAAAGKTTYLCGFQATYTGATAAGAGTVQATNTISGSLNYVAAQVAITNNNQVPIIVTFSPCVPASAVNTTIPVAATLGAGTTNTAVTANGFQL
jgi:hypothetical protein